MEVKDVKKVTFFENDDLVALVRRADILVRLYHGAELNLIGIHDSVPGCKIIVKKIVVIHQVPLSAAVVIAVTVAFSWEVDPFWVTKLVAHEVKVGLSSENLRN